MKVEMVGRSTRVWYAMIRCGNFYWVRPVSPKWLLAVKSFANFGFSGRMVQNFGHLAGQPDPKDPVCWFSLDRERPV